MRTHLTKTIAAGLLALTATNGVARLPAQPRRPAKAPLRVEQVAWALGTGVSLNAALHATGRGKDFVSQRARRSQRFASYLGVSLPAMPQLTGDKIKDDSRAVHYALTTCFKPIADTLRRTHGSETALVFEAGLKIGLLLIIYHPGSEDAATIVKTVENRLRGTRVPISMLDTIAEYVRTGRPSRDVRKAVLTLRTRVARALETSAPATRPARPKSRGKKKTVPSPSRVAWRLGGELTTMALMRANGTNATDLHKRLERCKLFARAVGVSVPSLPPLTGNRIKDNADALGYALRTCFKPVANAIQSRHGAEAAMLFEANLKLSTLLKMYQPGSETSTTIVRVAKQRLQRTKVPPAILEPLADEVRAKAPHARVVKALLAAQEAIDHELAAVTR